MIRQATIADVTVIFQLVKRYATQQMMILRPLSELYETIRDFFVCVNDGEVVGCVRLQVVWSDLAEVKSLAVRDERAGRGIGRALVSACVDESRRLGVKRLFTLTYVPGFFEKAGFKRVQKEQLPMKIWRECVRCPEYPDCNEIPLVRDLPLPEDVAGAAAAPSPHPSDQVPPG
jgi:amino-acid N-acetyltransferase